MKLSRKQMKQAAQDDLLHFARNAFNRIPDNPEDDQEIPEDQIQEWHLELKNQYNRIQKLFGIVEEDWLK